MVIWTEAEGPGAIRLESAPGKAEGPRSGMKPRAGRSWHTPGVLLWEVGVPRAPRAAGGTRVSPEWRLTPVGSEKASRCHTGVKGSPGCFTQDRTSFYRGGN